MEQTISSGSQIVIKANGVAIGGARSLTANQDFGVEGAYVIGSIMPAELVPQKWQGTLELDKFYIRKDIGVGANFEVSGAGILTVDPIDIEAIDRDTQQSLFIAQGCKLTSSNVSITANGFTGERASLQCLSMRRTEVGKPVMPSGL